MKLPRCEDARIPRRKITGYLLATAHPVGGPKAHFFLSRGFRLAAPEELEEVLRDLACRGQVDGTEASQWGTKYIVEGQVEAPDGAPLRLRTVWMESSRGAVPDFVTAYPARGE